MKLTIERLWMWAFYVSDIIIPGNGVMIAIRSGVDTDLRSSGNVEKRYCIILLL